MGDFHRDEVLFFMISKGGRVRNHELVTHFKNFLDHPNNKAQNRVLFKDYVNDLATVRVDGGEKVLVLKKKYRPPGPGDSFRSPRSSVSSTSSTSVSSLSTNSSHASLPSSSNTSSQSSLPKSPSSLPKSPSSTSTASDTDLTPTKSPREEAKPVSTQNESPRAQSEPPPAKALSVSDRSEVPMDNVDGLGMSRMRSDEQMDVMMKQTNRVPQQVQDAPSASGSTVSLTSNVSQSSLSVTSPSAASSTSSVATDDDVNASIISVKDKITKLNKIASETSLSRQLHTGGSGDKKKAVKYGGAGGEDDDASQSSGMTYITLDAEQREWMVTCSAVEYHDMNRLLSKNPGLARLKDLTNGYTALHWAAKSGKAEVIKLIANKPGVNVDQRSHGGYTPLHLAAIHGHEHIIELLVQTFKADANLRDYSGRKAKQYLKNSASSKAQQLLMSRRLGPDQASMRMSSRAKAMSSLMQSSVARQPMLRSSWAGSYEDMTEDREGRRSTTTPPGSGTPSPLASRRKHTMNLMPPPSNSVMGRRQKYPLDRSRSSSRESLTSSRSSLKNDENDNMVRSESDPNLVDGKKHTIV